MQQELEQLPHEIQGRLVMQTVWLAAELGRVGGRYLAPASIRLRRNL